MYVNHLEILIPHHLPLHLLVSGDAPDKLRPMLQANQGKSLGVFKDCLLDERDFAS